ncbi:MAG TPA: sensor histidine kinase [Candidatus Deferrimicrobiaceae bacterium]|nr:sensor histidine kinase [Candidatus Deferrimicrobiaceae bacterium]
MKALSKLQRYGLAVVSCGVALAVAWPIDAPASCFLLAVAMSSLFGGLGPGLLSIAFSAVAFNYLFLRRTIPPAVEPAVFFRFAVFVLATFIIAVLIEIKRRVEDSRNRTEEALRQANWDLARISRVTSMGELTASLAHEINQPIAAAVTDANTCLRWLTHDPPDLEEAREAASRTIKDATRAAEIIGRVRHLFKKGAPRRDLVDVNEITQEIVALLRSEADRYSISIRTELAADLPQVMGDRVQLQQVLMNLMMNSIDAMMNVDGARELTINSQVDSEQLVVSVSDTGVGLSPHQADQIFNAFFTTKPRGTGMGLRISRSIMESHSGRLWSVPNSPRGASFRLTLPIKGEAHE